MRARPKFDLGPGIDHDVRAAIPTEAVAKAAFGDAEDLAGLQAAFGDVEPSMEVEVLA